jgi:hypothetical protein
MQMNRIPFMYILYGIVCSCKRKQMMTRGATMTQAIACLIASSANMVLYKERVRSTIWFTLFALYVVAREWAPVVVDRVLSRWTTWTTTLPGIWLNATTWVLVGLAWIVLQCCFRPLRYNQLRMIVNGYHVTNVLPVVAQQYPRLLDELVDIYGDAGINEIRGCTADVPVETIKKFLVLVKTSPDIVESMYPNIV